MDHHYLVRTVSFAYLAKQYSLEFRVTNTIKNVSIFRGPLSNLGRASKWTFSTYNIYIYVLTFDTTYHENKSLKMQGDKKLLVKHLFTIWRFVDKVRRTKLVPFYRLTFLNFYFYDT